MQKKQLSYVVVPVADEKKTDESTQAASLRVMRTALRSVGGKGRLMKPVKMQVAVSLTWTPAANTVYNTAYALQPMNLTEGSAIANVFDEVKCLGGHVWWQTTWTASSPAGTTAAGMAFDPVDPTAYASVTGILLASQHTGPVFQGISLNQSPQPMSPGGDTQFRFKVPPGTALNEGQSAEIVGGSWFATKDTLAVVGYLKPYIEAGGGASVSNTRVFIRLDLLCRSRT